MRKEFIYKIYFVETQVDFTFYWVRTRTQCTVQAHSLTIDGLGRGLCHASCVLKNIFTKINLN